MAKRKIIQIDEEKCTGCGQCATACAEGAIELRGGKAKVISESFCDGLGACIGECPEGALMIVEREAPAFSEEKVKQHLGQKSAQEIVLACPSAGPRRIPTPKPDVGGRPTAQLANWPVQLRLAHPDAPYFKGARLLLAADCSAFAYAAMHSDFIKGRVTLIGCPKLDDVPASVEKLAQILELNDIQDITLVHMEVPCCSGLNQVVRRALERSKKKVPVETVVIGTDGSVLQGKASC